jgi:hypothetical protein
MHDHPDCLAKKEGWVSRDWETWVMNPSGLLVFKHDIPDYLKDLNAMHQAEGVLRDDREAAFRGWLWLAHGQPEMRCAIVHATAAQRAKAFLKTIGKWEEDE